ncbi:hypothetical protein PNK_1017 [Candidatus Protochlamydia naegleriophila]|uniref:Secreted protein n=1 Tax=Candidatus Protochlamydia naegleriophila TaxID=389348 RepID=A0A0U5ER38_9BACT|nr:hypothetical protein [Candidatus Protochlamydia naegleriophila]CUI16640.1 hypothetical protein PNK_1017 [Candidatus Protochlamydia naegleriophila]
MRNKKQLSGILTAFCLLTLSIEAAPNQPAANQANNPANPNRQFDQSQAAKTDARFNIMNRDQADGSDIYAIPYDDSEIEDEEEINRWQKKEVFPLPHSR